jgi:predicted enzyme related to lactoylglutathione lyase
MPTPSIPGLSRSASYFPVADVERTVAHYESVLGFRCEYAGGTPPMFAIVSRDGLPIMLRGVSDPAKIRPNESQGGTWDAFFWVDDAERLHDELVSKGAQIVYGPIVQQEYGMREFAARDLDGHVLGFGEPL